LVPLSFHLNDSLTNAINHADQQCMQELQESVDTVASTFEGFGKQEIKEMGYSPDAFVQMSYQLAYSKLHDGRPAATYEACSTASHFHGRTETIRSCSEEARSLVLGCLDNNVAKDQRVQLLNAAATQQSVLSRAAAGGMGVDRHLMALGALAKQNGMSNDANIMGLFEDPLYTYVFGCWSVGWVQSVFTFFSFAFVFSPYRRSSTWILSTSNVAAPWLSNFGFGPTAPDGYGLGYQILNDQVPMHITSWTASNESLTSQAMFDGICEAMDELKSFHQ
jgi:carnitine O-acetyltransferase